MSMHSTSAQVENARPACLFEAIEGYVVTRRNFLFGLWAGHQLGLTDAALSVYAQAVMDADLIEDGPEDLLAKLRADFRAAGGVVPEIELQRRLQECHRQELQQFAVTD